MDGSLFKRRPIFAALILLVLAVGVFVVVKDWKQVHQALAQADWRALPAALLLTALSYACKSYNFSRISQAIGIRMKAADLTEIGFLSAAINHVVMTGGVAGYSVRWFFMKDHGVSMEDTVAASVLHFYLTSLMMLGMLPVGLGYLWFNAHGSPGAKTALGALSVFLFAFFIFATLIVFHRPSRARVIGWVEALARWLGRRQVIGVLGPVDRSLDRGVKALRSSPRESVIIATLIVVDWVASLFTLEMCFRSLGPGVAVLPLLTGFVIGVMAGVLSMVPGGLGVQEGSMAGVFALLGYPFSEALLASILFRAVYFLLPFVVSLAFYYRVSHLSPGQDEPRPSLRSDKSQPQDSGLNRHHKAGVEDK